MAKITQEFKVTKEELETIQNEADRLEKLGYKVPQITIKMCHNCNGLNSGNNIYINPNYNLEELRFTVAHEIGHSNEPEFNEEFDIWDERTIDEKFEELKQKREDFANWFAANI